MGTLAKRLTFGGVMFAFLNAYWGAEVAFGF